MPVRIGALQSAVLAASQLLLVLTILGSQPASLASEEPKITSTDVITMSKYAKKINKRVLENLFYSCYPNHDEKDRRPLKNGKLSNKDDETVLYDSAIGDLNGDGINDAAVIILFNHFAGDGPDYTLIPVLNKKGQLYEAGIIRLGHAIEVKHLSIKSGIISVGLVVHRDTDGVVDPTLPITRKFKIVNDKLKLLR